MKLLAYKNSVLFLAHSVVIVTKDRLVVRSSKSVNHRRAALR